MKETEPTAFQRGIVLYGGREVTPFASDLFAVPLSVWWAPPRAEFDVLDAVDRHNAEAAAPRRVDR